MVCRELLVWEYFFKQKGGEIYDYFEEWWGPYFGMSMIVSLFLQIGWIPSGKTCGYYNGICEPIWRVGGIIGLSIISFWVVIWTIVLIGIIYGWLHNNWIAANAKADREIKKFRKQEKAD